MPQDLFTEVDPSTLTVEGEREHLAAALRAGAHGGAFAVWLTVTLPDRPGSQRASRLGKRRLATLFPQPVLNRMVVEIGRPGYIVHYAKRTQPVLYVRARNEADFRALALALWRFTSNLGGHLSVWDATEPAYAVIRRGIVR